jgi:hypothetical protein
LQQVPRVPALRHQPLVRQLLHRLLHPPQVLRRRLLVAVATAGLNPAH